MSLQQVENTVIGEIHTGWWSAYGFNMEIKIFMADSNCFDGIEPTLHT